MTTSEHAHGGGKAGEDPIIPLDERGINIMKASAEGKPWHVEHRGDEWCVVKDADNSEVACHATEEEAQAQARALYANEKAGAKAGRVIGSKAAAELKATLTEAVDAFIAKVNGTATEDAPQEKASDIPDEKEARAEFMKGYADGSAGRAARDGGSDEYVRGYTDGRADRSTVEQKEIDQLEQQLAGLEIKRS